MKLYMLLVGVICVLFSGCAHFKNSQTLQQNLQFCKQDCRKQLDVCNRKCVNGCRNCTSASNRVVDRNYKGFVHRQTVQGGLLNREPNSYRDPLQCLKMTCDCLGDWTQCVQACQGTLQLHYRVAPTCC